MGEGVLDEGHLRIEGDVHDQTVLVASDVEEDEAFDPVGGTELHFQFREIPCRRMRQCFVPRHERGTGMERVCTKMKSAYCKYIAKRNVLRVVACISVEMRAQTERPRYGA